MPDKTWKKAEREIASLLGGERVPITGRIRGSAPDIEHEWLSIEVKHRDSLPAWILDAMNQADASAKAGQLPIVVLHQKQMMYADSVVMVRVSDFAEWFGK